MNKHKKQSAFTLVELIVVITILAILGTIAFISLEGYSAQSRDSVRISDMASMKTGLELFQLDAGKYPLPTSGVNIVYSGSTVWNQGTFGNTVYTNLSKLDKIPLDPLTNKEYTYSVISTRNEYELGGMVEGDVIGMNYIIPQSNAGTTEAIALITGNYNGLMTKTLSGTTSCNVLSLPSIIANDVVTSTDLVQIVNNKGLVYNGYKNLPSSFKDSKFKYNGGFDFSTNNLVAYTDTGSCSALTDNSSSTARVLLLKGLQDAYTGTLLKDVGEIKNITALSINTSNPSNDVINYAGNFVNNVLGGSIVASNAPPTYSTCSFNGNTLIHNTSVTAYLTGSVSFGNTCTSELRLCTDGVLSGTFTSTGCTVSGATGTFNLSQTSITIGNNITLSNTCSQAPTSYTSSNTAVATVAGTTITTLTTGTTNITPVGGACGNNVAKTLIVTPSIYTNINGSISSYIPDGANISGRFTLTSGTVGNSGNGVILDNLTGLYWMSDGNVLGTKTWVNAKIDCAGLSLGGYDDWRLPDFTELYSIVDFSNGGSVNTSFFSSASSNYWTSIIASNNTSNALVIFFTTGLATSTFKTGTNYVRCVH